MHSPARASDAFVRGPTGCLRVLVVCASPLAEGTPLDVRGEWARLKDVCVRDGLPVCLVRLLPPTSDELAAQLRMTVARRVTPHVLHFACHGESHHLLLEDDLGVGKPYSRDELADLLRVARVPVVVLNACHSATRSTIGLAQRLTEGEDAPVKVAIGHAYPVSDAAAVAFAGMFYQALARGRSAFAAWTAGRVAMSRIDRAAADAVKLYGDDNYRFLVRHGAAETYVFEGTRARIEAPDVAQFFGRTDELMRLGAVVADPNIRALAVCGIGGIGKTILVLELIHRHAWRFPGGVVFVTTRTRASPTTLALLTEASALLGASDAGLAPSQSFLRACLSAPAVVVFDGVENLPADELSELVRVISLLPPNDSKVVLTTRLARGLDEWPWLSIEHVTTGLSLPAGAAMAAREAQVHGVSTLCGTLRDGLWQGPPLWLAQAVSGHPTLIERMVETVATNGLEDCSVATVRQLALETTARCVVALLTPCVSTLGVDGQAVLELLPVFPIGDVSAQEGVAAMAALMTGDPSPTDPAVIAEADRRWVRGTAEAVRAGLLGWDDAARLWRFHPMVAANALRSQTPNDATDPVWLAVFGAAARHVMAHLEDAANIERRLHHLFHVFEQAWQYGERSAPLRNAVAALVDKLGDHLFDRSHWDLMDRWRDRLGQRTDEAPDQRSARLYKEAVFLHGRGQLGEARALLDEVLRSDDQRGDHQGCAAARHELASIEYEQGDLTRARRLLRESIAVSEQLGDHRGRAASLHLLATIESQQDNLGEARGLLGDVISTLEALGDRQALAAALHQLAIVEITQGNPAEARRLLADAIALKLEVGDRRGLAASRYQLAMIETNQGNLAAARRLLRDVIQVEHELGDRRAHAVSLHQLAIVEISQGDLVAARRLLGESIAIKVALDDPRGRAASIHQLAVIEEAEGHPDEARRLLQEAIAVFAGQGDVRGLAASRHQLAILAETQGDFDEARGLLHESLAAETKLGNRRGAAASLHQLAIIETRQGDLAAARRLLDVSIAIDTELGDRRACAASLHQLANIEAREGDLDAAERRYTESAAIKRDLGDLHGHAITLGQLGQITAMRGDRIRGAAQVRDAIDILRRVGTTEVIAAEAILGRIEDPLHQQFMRASDLVESLITRAHDAVGREAHAEAAALAGQAVDIIRETAEPTREPEAHFLLGQALLGLSRFAEAQPHLRRAFELLAAAGRGQHASAARHLLAIAEQHAQPT